MGGGRSRPRELQGSDAENEGEEKEEAHATDRAPHGGAAARERAADRNRSKEGNGGEARKKVNYPKEVLFHAKQLGLNPDKVEEETPPLLPA